MKFVALDVASQTGIAVGSSGATPKLWSVDLGRGKSEDYRFSSILRLTHGLIEHHSPDMVVIEASIGGKNASAYLIGLVACVRGCAFNRGIKVEMVFPATVRKHFLGVAKTSRHFPGMKPAKAKLAIKGEVMDRCKLLGWDVPDLDASDAGAIFDWACATFSPGFQAKPTGELFK